jgi:putative flippase GtrA
MWSKMLNSVKERYGELFRAAKFGIASAVGFLVVEIILTVGVYILYGRLFIPSSSFSSPSLISLNIVAFFVGITVAFVINERITVRVEPIEKEKRARQFIIRLFKFQLVYALGNAITIGVQLLFLESFGLAPTIGNIIGAIVAFPISYVISMKVVWNRHSSQVKAD